MVDKTDLEKGFLNYENIPKSPISDKVPAYISREHHFIDFFIKENLRIELYSRLSGALIEIDLLMHEILTFVNDDDNTRQLDRYEQLYTDAFNFKAFLKEKITKENIIINSNIQKERYAYKSDLDRELGNSQPYLNNELSTRAKKLRGKFETNFIRGKSEGGDNPFRKNLSNPATGLKIWLYEEIGERTPKSKNGLVEEFNADVYNWYSAIKNRNGVARTEEKKTIPKHIEELETHLDSLIKDNDEVAKKAYNKLLELRKTSFKGLFD